MGSSKALSREIGARMLAGGRPGEEAKSQVIGELCDKVFSLRLWLFVPFVAAFDLYCLNHSCVLTPLALLPYYQFLGLCSDFRTIASFTPR
jgi:hypothetical protein